MKRNSEELDNVNNKPTLGKKHRITADDLRYAAHIVQMHVTRNRLEQVGLQVKSHKDSLFGLRNRLNLAASYEEQNANPD